MYLFTLGQIVSAYCFCDFSLGLLVPIKSHFKAAAYTDILIIVILTAWGRPLPVSTRQRQNTQSQLHEDMFFPSLLRENLTGLHGALTSTSITLSQNLSPNISV